MWHQDQIAAGATVGRDCTLGKGAYVGAGGSIGDLVKIGNYACVFRARIADAVMICPGALLLDDQLRCSACPCAYTRDGDHLSARDRNCCMTLPTARVFSSTTNRN